jgi:hypothetical protein
LWPGQGLSTDFVAIQAVGGLELGDQLRFRITPFLSHADIAIATPPFTIDELPADSDAGVRIAH